MGRSLLPSDNHLTRQVLPLAVKNFDPARDYVPSSPYISPEKVERHSRVQTSVDTNKFAPEQHIYGGDVSEGGFRKFMQASAAHFCSETGPINFNAMSESPELVARELPRLRRLWNVDPATVAAETEMMTHQADRYCVTWCDHVKRNVGKMFGREFSPDDPEELVAAVNFFVGDLFKYAIESWRMQKFRRTGILWWSLLDMWPMGFNYSAVDSNFKKKYPFDVIRLYQQPVALMGEEPAGTEKPKLHIVNDTLANLKGTYRATAPDGVEILKGTFAVSANGREYITDLPLQQGEVCFLEWECGEFSGRNYYLNPGEPYDFPTCRRLAEKIRTL